jgi:quercetin dioxygenase-like cupin family protein
MESKEVELYDLYSLSQGLARNLAPGIATRIFCGENVMLSVVRLEPGAQGEIHSHEEEQWDVMLEGDGVRFQDGEEFSVKAGNFWRTPSGVSHGIRVGESGALILDIFSPPREAYRKPGSGFGSD